MNTQMFFRVCAYGIIFLVTTFVLVLLPMQISIAAGAALLGLILFSQLELMEQRQ